jgi:phage replication O-like protein O
VYLANPQVENGHLKIANEVWEHLIVSGMSGSEFPIVMAVIRQSWGWKKKQTEISLLQFKGFTRLPERTIAHCLKSLVHRKILIHVPGGGRGNSSKWTFNKDWEKWETVQPIAEIKHATINSAKINSVSYCSQTVQPIAENNAVNCTVSIQKLMKIKENRPPKAIIKAIKAIQESSTPAPRDEAYDLFVLIFEQKTGSPYLKCKGDFPQLAALRKAFGIGGKETPPDWQTACRNYLDSPLGSYSISYLVTGNRYAVLRRNKIDRYGKPQEEDYFDRKLREAEEEDMKNGKSGGD